MHQHLLFHAFWANGTFYGTFSANATASDSSIRFRNVLSVPFDKSCHRFYAPQSAHVSFQILAIWAASGHWTCVHCPATSHFAHSQLPRVHSCSAAHQQDFYNRSTRTHWRHPNGQFDILAFKIQNQNRNLPYSSFIFRSNKFQSDQLIMLISSFIFTFLCLAINIGIILRYQRAKKLLRSNGMMGVAQQQPQQDDTLERRLTIYAVVSFLGQFIFVAYKVSHWWGASRTIGYWSFYWQVQRELVTNNPILKFSDFISVKSPIYPPSLLPPPSSLTFFRHPSLAQKITKIRVGI